MQAIVVRKIGSFEVTECDRPRPGPGEVLIEVAVAGLCRTDLKIVEVGHRDLVLPRIPAEEVVGKVCDLGPKTDKSIMGKGVYIYPGASCGQCYNCRHDAENLCVGMQIMGFHRDGGFAEYVVAPEKSLIAIPAETAFETAIFTEPLSCCLNALELARLSQGESIAIWGGGPAGTLLARAAVVIGATPTVIEPNKRRRQLLSGVPTVPDLFFDVAVVAVGDSHAYRQAARHLAPRGRLVIFSGLAPMEAEQMIDLNQLHYQEQTIVGAYGCSYRHGVMALEWISQGKIMVSDMISHRLSLDQFGQALELVKNRKGMKILIYPREKINE